MSYLVFCSFEVGGLPYKIAETLDRQGVPAIYFSSAGARAGHDSTRFHFGDRASGWDLTPREWEDPAKAPELVARLERIAREHEVRGCFASGAQAHLLARAGIPYVYWSYGSDLDEDCFARDHYRRYPLWKRTRRRLRFYRDVRRPTRASIRRAQAVMIAPYQSAALARVTTRRALFFLPHLLPAEPREQMERRRETSREQICAEIDAERFLFSAARHVWTERHRRLADRKGNDVALRGFAQYLARARDDRGTKLVLVRKGLDVEASEVLVGELGIGSRVVWVDEMPRERLQTYYSGASLCFGQFATPAITYAALEPLACGTPCVSWFERGDPAVPLYSELPPIANTRDPVEIAELLQRAVAGEERHAAQCLAGWTWARENCSEERFAARFVEVFAGARP